MTALILSIVLLTNVAYRVAYDTEARGPAWVAYDLEPEEVVTAPRAPFAFRADPRVPESDVAADYAGSGYDRGHMAPAADFNFDRDALESTYLLTNILPQEPKLNRGAWAQYEAELRELARRGTVHILAYPEYDAGVTNLMGRVRIPDAFVKVASGWFGVRHRRFDNRRTDDKAANDVGKHNGSERAE